MSLTDYQLDARRLVKELFTVPEPEPKGDANRIYEQLETPEGQNALAKIEEVVPLSARNATLRLVTGLHLTIHKLREYSNLEIDEMADKLPKFHWMLSCCPELEHKFSITLNVFDIKPDDPDYETQAQKHWDLYRNGTDGIQGLKGRLIDHIRNLVKSKDGEKDSAFIEFKHWVEKEGLSDMVYLDDDDDMVNYGHYDCAGMIEEDSVQYFDNDLKTEVRGRVFTIDIDRYYTEKQIEKIKSFLYWEFKDYLLEILDEKIQALNDKREDVFMSHFKHHNFWISDIQPFVTEVGEILTDLSDSSLSPEQRKSVKCELQDFIKESIFAEVIRLKTDEDEGTEVRQEGTEGAVHGRSTCVVDKPRQGQYSNLTEHEKLQKTAIDKLLEARTDDGEELFSYGYQWYAVYRVLKEHRQSPTFMPDFLKKMINWGYKLNETKVHESMKKVSQDCSRLPPKTEDWVLKKDKSKTCNRLVIVAEFLLHELGIKE